jgi:hypothetical protein
MTTRKTTTPRVPPAPSGLSTAGRALWRSVVADFDLDQHERLLLREACRTADRLDRLAGESARADVTARNRFGEIVIHPAQVEARQQSLALARLLASLRLPAGEEDGRPQRRGAARGSYGIRGVA